MSRLLQYVKISLYPKTFCNYSSETSLAIGNKAKITKSFSAEDVKLFADLTNDTNPIHLDEEYAKTTGFKRKLVHGMLCAGLVSGVLGSVFPGPGSIVLSWQMRYPAPLYVGEEVTAEVAVRRIQGRKVMFDTKCTVEASAKVVCEGSALLIVPKNVLPASNNNH